MRLQFPPITKNLLLINILLFLLGLFLENQGINLQVILSSYFPFSPNFQLYQVITHMFMHGSFMHLLFNMLALWSFGATVEFTLGSQRFLILYLLSGLAGMLFFDVYNYIQIKPVFQVLYDNNFDFTEFYQHLSMDNSGRFIHNPQQFKFADKLQQPAQQLFDMYTTPMLGATAATSGLLAAFAVFYPNAKIMMMFPPIPIKAKYLMPGILILYAYLGFSNSSPGIAHFAHLGGALFGLMLALIYKPKLGLSK